MRGIVNILATILVTLPISAFACRELAVFPPHLEVKDGKYHYLVEIQRAADDGFLGTVKRSFGGAFASGQHVVIRFKLGEEAHAVCPIQLTAGQTYLLHSESTTGALEISRFNWLNIPATHERFDVYVQDLATAQSMR
jgi:hypothetical protein